MKASKKNVSISSASSTISEDEELESDMDEDDFELIEYFDANSNESQSGT